MTALARVQPATLRPSYARFNAALVEKYIGWIGVRGRSPHTLRAFRRALERFADFLGPASILAVDHATVLQHLTGLYDGGLGKSSVFVHI
jgi:site-specific recombinase XerD